MEQEMVANAARESGASDRRQDRWAWRRIGSPTTGKAVGRLALWCVGSAMIANLLFNLAAWAAGLHHPYSIFLSVPRDRFADFFKLSFSYPGPPLHPTGQLWQMDARFASYQAFVNSHAHSLFNHFHEPPLTTLMAFSWRQLMSVVDPVLLYAFFVAAGLAALTAVIVWSLDPLARGWSLAIVAIVNYPVAFMVDRGHLFSLACALALLAALLRTPGKRGDWVAITLYALAINVRPNAAIFPALLFICRRFSAIQLISVGLASLALLIGALAITHMLYPAYGPTSFVTGLFVYSSFYIKSDLGLAYGSSLFGALKVLFGTGVESMFVQLTVTTLLLVGLTLASHRRRLSDAATVYLIACAYCLVSPVFADYHLIVFLAPLVLLARQGELGTRTDWAVFIGCCFVLAPKNYLFQPDPMYDIPWSWQIVANPAMLIATAAYVIGCALAGTPKIDHAIGAGLRRLRPPPGSAASFPPPS